MQPHASGNIRAATCTVCMRTAEGTEIETGTLADPWWRAPYLMHAQQAGRRALALVHRGGCVAIGRGRHLLAIGIVRNDCCAMRTICSGPQHVFQHVKPEDAAHQAAARPLMHTE